MTKSEWIQLVKETNWHALSEQEVFEKLETNKSGLGEAAVAERLEMYGPNTLPAPKQPTIWDILLHQVANPLIFILVAAAVASVMIGEGVDALFIFVVIALNTALGAYQEFKAQKSASSLQKMLRIKALVRRDGKSKEVPSEDLVPGDVVLLESGAKVPADLRLFEANNLASDESFLTGESVAAEKHTDPLDEGTVVNDRDNTVFAGSTITSGRGRGIVIATGTATQVGMIAQSVAESETAKPPLVQRMEKFTKNISAIVLGLSVVLAIMLRFQGYDAAAIFFFVVALAVSAIPEGLPVALTVALSIATKRMSNRNVIVRRLTAVESLGSCTVIASDKTGTLTVNQQTAKQIVFPNGKTFTISGEGYHGEGKVLSEGNASLDDNELTQLKRLTEVAILANEASLVHEQDEWSHRGDAMDVALLALGYKVGLAPMEMKDNTPLLGEIPYESERKFSAAFFEKNGKTWVAAKGAVETILDFCTHAQQGDEQASLERKSIEKQADEMAENGLRVLAFAGGACPDFEKKSKHDADELSGLTFYGLVGFIDPLRSEAADAVNKCKKAGIKVLMITGDHPATAGAIAQELGIFKADEQTVVTGQQLSEAGGPDDTAFQELVLSTTVFARVSPTQKLEIVDVLIKNGEFVAVTGDGVNDTPALRRANIGVAMGSGTDAAKEVGSMIIVDDNFSSIVAGVEEGRFAYDNVRKVIFLLISTGAAEVFLFVAAIMFQLPLPLLAVQLLWLNLVTNGIQDVALAFEGGEPGAMKRKPRKTSERIFNPRMISQTLVSGITMGLLAFGTWYWLIEIVKMDEESARNDILLLFVLMQNVHAFNSRSETTSVFRVPLSRNYLLVFGVLVAQGIHILSMHIPFMQGLLRVEPVSPFYWKTLLLLAATILVVMEVYKWWVRRREG